MDDSVRLIVLLSVWVKLWADCWLAEAPAGIDIMIAMEKASAIITNDALIFRLDMFLNARFAIPIQITYVP